MKYDLIIIGMGISGISAAIYAKNGGLNILILEKENPGGLLNKINTINNYPGYSNITGPDLSYNLFESINNLNIPYKIEEVIDIEVNEEEKIVHTTKESYKTKYIIIASGRNPRKLNIENEEKLLGHGISTCAICDGNLYKGENVAVIGGGNSALEEALYLANIVNKVYLIHRRDCFKADDYLTKQLKNKNNIEILYNSQVTKINSHDEQLSSIEINHEKTIDIKGLFVYIGFESNSNYLKNLNITNEVGNIIIDEKYETKIKGIYAVGDAIEKNLYQLITAASEGATASVNIIKDSQKDN